MLSPVASPPARRRSGLATLATLLLTGLCLFVPSQAAARTAAPPTARVEAASKPLAGPPVPPSLAAALDANGRLRPGVAGSFSGAGFRMRTGPDGAPVFVRDRPAMPAAAPAAWMSGFGLSGFDGDVWALAVSGTDVYVGGRFTTTGALSTHKVAKWNGSAWSALGTGLNGDVYALAVSGTDVYAGGSFTTAGGVSASNVAKWNGSAWSALGDGLSGGEVWALAVMGTDVYAGGDFTNKIARWNGSGWGGLGTGMSGGSNGGTVFSLAVMGADLYAGGFFTHAGGVSANKIARWNGSAWSALGTSITAGHSVSELAVIGTDLYAGGFFTAAGGVSASNVAKWNGSAWSALGTGISGSVDALAVSGTDLYVGGAFTSAGGVSANGVAKWDGSAWSAIGTGTSGGGVAAIAVSGTDVYAGGNFTTAGGVSVSRMAKWNGATWSAVGPSTTGAGLEGDVYAVAVIGADVYVGGDFTNAGGNANADWIARWNGSAWSALGTGIGGGTVYALAVMGTDLYVGGSFTSAGGVGARNVAKWNGAAWSRLGTGTSGGSTGGDVYALAVMGTDLYVGGVFTSAGGVGASNVAKWDGSTWSALSIDDANGTSGGNVEGDVYALAVMGTDLYVGGDFTMAGGVSVSNVAKWDGSAWSTLGDADLNGRVYALATLGADLYVGGGFDTIFGEQRARIARWDGSSWHALGEGLNGDVRALAVNGTDLYVGGTFTSAGSALAARVARWDGSAWSALGDGVGDEVRALSANGSGVFAGGFFTTAGAFASARFGIYSFSGELPVELASFTATTDGAGALLRWTTASETNNAGFAVEVRAGAGAWREVGWVSGHGTTAESHAYAHRVEGLKAGRYAFRLRQVDLDGTASYSREVEAAVGMERSFLLTLVAPNPARGAASFTVAVREPQWVRAVLYDALGREVAVLLDRELEASRVERVEVDATTLPPGAYVVGVSGEHFAASRTVTLVK